MRLGTTTWRRRNEQRLIRTVEVAKKLGLYRPMVLDYGPGGVIDFLIDLLPEGDKSKWNSIDKIRRGIIRPIESVLRKTNLFSLETSEPEEIAYIFHDLSPSQIYVVDKERRVIDAVQRMVERNRLPVPIRYETMDIQDDQLEHQGDIVIAYFIIERTANPAISLEHIARTTRVNGLFSTSYNMLPDGFEQKEDGLYQRIK